MFAAYGPCNAGISISIATINFIFVVEVYGVLKSYRRVLDPFKNLFRPIHPQVSMHATTLNHLTLTGIPQLIMRLRMFQFLEAIVPGTRIKRVFPQCLLSPAWATF